MEYENCCPYCKSEDIFVTKEERYKKQIDMQYRCNNCKEKHIKVYELVYAYTGEDLCTH